MSTIDSVERSIHVFELIGNINFNDIEDTIGYIERERSLNPDLVLYDVGEPTRYLYLDKNGLLNINKLKVIWVKFGWARTSGLPETLNITQGRSEFLTLPSGIYLYEPAHFIIFNHNNKNIMLQEFNFFGPRATKLCNYIVEFFKKMKGKSRVRLVPRRVFMRGLDELLREYNIVKSMKIELVPDAIGKFARLLGSSETAFDFLRNLFNPGKIAIYLRSRRGEELQISTDKILEIFYELEEELTSLSLVIKKGLRETIRIDLKKQAAILRKRIRYARDSKGNIYRSTDTEDAIRVLSETINDVIRIID